MDMESIKERMDAPRMQDIVIASTVRKTIEEGGPVLVTWT